MTARASGSSLESLEEQQVGQHLRDMEDRLVTEYASQPDIGEDRVRHALGRVRERFADARIHAFLPILVERAAREELNASPPQQD
jgi:hypothetical protein